MTDCTYPKCQQTAIPGCQGLCRDLSANRRATDGQSFAMSIMHKNIDAPPEGQHDTARGVPERLRKYVEYRRKTQMHGFDEVIHSVNGLAELRLSDLYALLDAAPTPPAGDAGQERDRRDAKRYRYLRDECDLSVRDVFGSWCPHLNDGMDIAIDAAIAASEGEK